MNELQKYAIFLIIFLSESFESYWEWPEEIVLKDDVKEQVNMP
jgi:hypothetical protein